jgi:hypothetical protein
MDWEDEAKKAIKRINELEKEISSLKSRMDSQYNATADLLSRPSKLERATDPTYPTFPCTTA